MDNSRFEFVKAETNLKRSLELDSSKEELDFFNGKLTKDEIKKLMVRLSILKRNIEVKGQELREKMCDPTLLDVLAKKMHKFLLKLQAHGRARRLKEKKEIRKKSGKKHKVKVQLSKEAKLEAKFNISHDDFEAIMLNKKCGRKSLIKGHKKKHFKEDLKPP